jgi:hypothetical protein
VTETQRLIDDLVAGATPVRRLRPPLVRALSWVALAGAILALLAIGHGVRSDLVEHLRQPIFLVSIAAALATGVLAAIAAFMVSLPDRPQSWLLLPLPALIVWVGTIGYGCLTDWIAIGPDGVHLGETLRCFATLVLTSVPLAITLTVMLRHTALLRPVAATLAGALAVAAITSSALALLHDIDATAMILIWNAGIVALIAGFATVFGRAVLRWTALRFAPTRTPPEGAVQ